MYPTSQNFSFRNGDFHSLTGRAKSTIGPFFTTNIKEVPDETRNKFQKPELETTEERRAKYGLDREFATPRHVREVMQIVLISINFTEPKLEFITMSKLQFTNVKNCYEIMSIK